MQNPFQKAKDLNEMRKQAKQLQDELDAEKIEVQKGNIKVIITGSQKVESIEIDGQEQIALRSAVQEGLTKAQHIASRKLATMSGGLANLLK